jgi:predicted DNA-binding protein
MPDPKVTSLRMPETMTIELVAIAHARNISLADTLREALEEYITARRSDASFKERLKKILEEDGEVFDSLEGD